LKQKKITKLVNSSWWDAHPFCKGKKKKVSTLLKVGCSSVLAAKKNYKVSKMLKGGYTSFLADSFEGALNTFQV
jgi:hypothetical protein